MVRPPKQEVSMKLITIFELASRNKAKLHSLYRAVFNELAKSKPDTPERRTALASLENIRRVINSRAFCP